MKKRVFRQSVLVLLAILVIVPSSLFTAPRPAHAIFGSGVVFDPWNNIVNTISSIADKISAFAGNSLYIKEYVLDSIAWAIGQQLIQSLTGSVVNWINGGNGGGFSLFVQNLPLHLLNSGDIQAISFFNEFGTNSNSIFSQVILSSLHASYLQNTSRDGYWAANRSTLPRYSRNPQAFLRGDFKQGGFSAWFALTTQRQNNPYAQRSRAEAQLAGRIGRAEQEQRDRLNWGNGFLSWCGSGDGAAQTASQQQFLNAGAGANGPLLRAMGAQQCKTADGEPGTVQTPGSVIHGQLSKALGTTYDRLVSSDELNEIIGALMGKLITTVTGAAGLSGASAPAPGGRLIDLYTNPNPVVNPGTPPPPPGTGPITVAASITSFLDTIAAQLTNYQNSMQTIGTAANLALTAANNAIAICSRPANVDTHVQNAINTIIQPAIDRVTASGPAIANARANIAQIRAEIAAVTTADQSAAVSTKVQDLQSMPPTTSDIFEAQFDAQQTPSGSRSSSIYSLSVVGGSLVTQLTLIRTNAQNLARDCFGRTFNPTLE